MIRPAQHVLLGQGRAAEPEPPGPGPSPSTYSETVLSDSPVGYWALDESSGAATLSDSSGNGHDLTVTGTVSAGAEALVNGSSAGVQFNDSGYLSNADPELQISGDVTLEAWIKQTGAPNEAQFFLTGLQGADNNALSDAPLYSMRLASLEGVAGYTSVARHGYDGGGGTRYTYSAGPSVLELAHSFLATTHIVITRDAAERRYRIYVDGSEVETDTYTENQDVTGGGIFNIGGWAGESGTSMGFQGIMASVAVYDSVLSPERIQAHYSAGAGA